MPNRLNFALLGQKIVLVSRKRLGDNGRQLLKAIRYPCPLWVKSRHSAVSEQCPLCPQKQTLVERVGMSALCVISTFPVS